MKLYPKVKRVYIAGDVKDWKTGNVKKKSGRTVHGVAIEYEQSRKGFQRRGFTDNEDEPVTQPNPQRLDALLRDSDKFWKFHKMLKTYISTRAHRSCRPNIEVLCRMSASEPKMLNCM